MKKETAQLKRQIGFPLCAFLLLLMCGLGCGLLPDSGPSPEEPGSRGFEKETVPAPGLAPGKRYAVCIGISAYRNLPDLRYAHLDAEDVYDFLISDAGGYDMENCVLLCDSSAEDGRVLKKEIESLFTTWMARVRPEDSVFIFYSGHGIPRGRDSAFMAGWDTEPNDLYPTAIPMNRLRVYLEEMIAAERVVVALDTCFSGALGGKTFLPVGQRQGAFDDTSLEQVVQGQGRVILTASTGSQAAHELAALGHGIFTYCMLQGLRGEANLDGDDRVTLSELWLYLQRHVPEEAGRLGLRQDPVRKGDETGDILLARTKMKLPLPDEISGQENEEVVAALLGGARLMSSGFYRRAIEKFLMARPYLPPDKQAILEALIEECHTLAIREEAGEGLPAAGTSPEEMLAFSSTLAEADFRDGRTAEAQGLWDMAIAYYQAAREASSGEQQDQLDARITACRTEKEAETVYSELKQRFNAAEEAPGQDAYAGVQEKVEELEKLGKGPDYKDLGFIKATAQGENTGDDSRKYFGWGTRAREGEDWTKAIQWFEKAKEGAGGRYPEEIETNLRFCRLSLAHEIKDLQGAAKEAYSAQQFDECLEKCAAWLVLDPEAEQAGELQLLATRARARQLFDEENFASCRAFLEQALETFPKDQALTQLAGRVDQEDLPPRARSAWKQAQRAEEAVDWVGVEEALTKGLNLPASQGFNDHYRRMAESKRVQAQALAYGQLSRQAQEALDRGDFTAAHRDVDRALAYRPGFAPALRLKEQVEKKAQAQEQEFYLAARQKAASPGLSNQGTARSQEDFTALREAIAAYESYLSLFPQGRWSEEARTALARLEEQRGHYPRVEGFSLLRAETFSSGDATHTVAVYLHESTHMEFVLLPGGTYWMGSPHSEEGRKTDEDHPRTVTVAPFLICRTECTLAGWNLIRAMDRRVGDGLDLPKNNLTWNDCDQWCRKLGLRLPTEEEWEYACRAGTSTRFSFGDSETDLKNHAWYTGSAGNRLHLTGHKKPNAFGLFDMHGNVWEWCQDPFRDGARKVSGRVIRGGGWNFTADACRSASRSWDEEVTRNGVLGFRPVKSLN